MDDADLVNRVSYHPPGPLRAEQHAEVRSNVLDLARVLNALLPEGREKSLAVTKLEECLFWSNASLARNPTPAYTPPAG